MATQVAYVLLSRYDLDFEGCLLVLPSYTDSIIFVTTNNSYHSTFKTFQMEEH